ncbi:hypothetical protein Bca52824_088042 [Brassica carinata]|uniref:Uncharacterized protein n=1 Tax=Brassica carinata TaxID=52824 RepID=A0A8X7TNU7_BRACI|nr:hypothetical protein Bca52824_088042 [Brassica carinata]
MQIPSRTKARRGAELLEDYNRPQVVQHSPLSPASSAVDMIDVQEICRNDLILSSPPENGREHKNL